MLQILNWLCLISVCFLSIQVFLYMCKDTMKLYKKYEIGMGLKELSPKTIYGYKSDLYSCYLYCYLY